MLTLTTNVIVNHWNEISWFWPKILPAPFRHVENVSTYVGKSCKVDNPRITSFDASSTADPDPIDAIKSYDEIEGSTLFLLSMLKKNVEVFVSFLFMIFVFNFRMIFIFSPILTFRFSISFVNSILTFYRYCYYLIYTDIAYMICYNFLMVFNKLSFWYSQQIGILFLYNPNNVFDLYFFCNLLKI